MIDNIFFTMIIGVIVGLFIWYITKEVSKKMTYKRLSKSIMAIQSNRDKFNTEISERLKNKLTKELEISQEDIVKHPQFTDRVKNLDSKLKELEVDLDKSEQESKVFKKYRNST